MVDINVTLIGLGFGAKLSTVRTVGVYPWVWDGELEQYVPTRDNLGASPSLIHGDTHTVYARVPTRIERAPDKLEFAKLSLRKILTGSALFWQMFLTSRGSRR